MGAQTPLQSRKSRHVKGDNRQEGHTIKSKSIMKNPHVKELLAITEANEPAKLGALLAILNHVSAAERQLNQAIGDLNAMRKELETMQAKNRPLAQKALTAAQAQVQDLRDKVAELRQSVIDGCKKGISAFRQKGVSALDNISRFFKVRSLLEGVREQTNKCIASLEKLEACAAQKPSLKETLQKHAQKSKEKFGGADLSTERKEPAR